MVRSNTYGTTLWLAALVLGFMGGSVTALDGPETRPNWIAERVDAPRFFRVPRHGMAVDGDGDPHVAYGGDRLYYASSDGGVWTLDVADDMPGVGVGAALVMDGTGRAHIAHVDGPNDRILYTTNASGSWVTQVIDTTAPDTAGNFNDVNRTGGRSATIALDGGGDVHVAYHDAGAGELRYATNRTGAWVVQTVDGSGSGTSRSLAVTAAGKAHISYTREGVDDPFVTGRSQTLRYATNASGRWRNELVDGANAAETRGVGVGQGNTILLDSGGAVHIVYRDNGTGFDGNFEWGGVIHTTKAGRRWTRTRVAGFRTSGSETSAAIDDSDTIHVSHRARLGRTEYAHNTGGTWSNEAVFDDGSANAIGVSGGGTVHIANQGFTGSLEVASGTAGSFTSVVVDTSVSAGLKQAIAVDAAGAAHVAYFRHPSDILYASNASGSWQSELLDTGGSPLASEPSIVVDASGNVHLAYDSYPDLRYAHDMGGPWAIETVHTSVIGVGNAGLAVVGTVAHVVYRGATGLVYANNSTGSFVSQDIDAGSAEGNGVKPSIAVDGAGDVHVTYGILTGGGTGEALKYATNASGPWVAEVVATATGSAGLARATVAVASDGTPHVVFSSVDFSSGAAGFRVIHGTRTPSGWTLEDVVSAGALWPHFALGSDDAAHVAYTTGEAGEYDLAYATNHGGAWRTQIVDRGGLGGRAFGAAHYTVREGDLAAAIPILATGRVELGLWPAIAVDSLGGAHIAYPDLTLQDTKYAYQSAAVPSPTVTVGYDAVAGTATANVDFTPASGTAGWSTGDGGSRIVYVAIEDDDLVEGSETVALSLENPTGGAILGEPSTATLLIEDDDVAPEGAVIGYLLPRNLTVRRNKRRPQKSRLVAAGFVDTGPGPVDLSGPATLDVGDISVSVPGLVQKRKGFDFRAAGLVFRIIPSPGGGSRARFRMLLTSNEVNEIGPDSQLRMHFRAGSVDAAGEFVLGKGRYRLGREAGTLIDPVVFPVKAVASLIGPGKDKLNIAAGLGTLGGAPPSAPDVRIAFAGVFEETVSSGDFSRSRDGSRYTYTGAAGGLTKLILDYKREKLTAIGKALDLGDFPDGPQPALVTVEVDGVDIRNVAIRMLKKRKSLKY